MHRWLITFSAPIFSLVALPAEAAAPTLGTVQADDPMEAAAWVSGWSRVAYSSLPGVESVMALLAVSPLEDAPRETDNAVQFQFPVSVEDVESWLEGDGDDRP